VNSLKWFIQWLGPNLTTENIAKPLLRNMSKILIEHNTGVENCEDAVDRLLQKVAPHIECLIEMQAIYGDNIMMNMYLPHIAKLVGFLFSYDTFYLCKTRYFSLN